MTLKEMKVKTFSLIEEYYPEHSKLAEDEDVINKINSVVNQVQMDLMKYRKINAKLVKTITKNSNKTIELPTDCYQLKKVVFNPDTEYELVDDITIELPNDYVGTMTMYYYKTPELVQVVFANDTAYIKEDNDYEFELDPVLLEIMPYGIAADLLKLDMISSYGKYFYERYLEMRQSIDSRKTSGFITSSGGVDI